jgi:high affinity sulfate transporter 1
VSQGNAEEDGVTKRTQPRKLSNYIPILGWLPHYQPAWLTADLMAGLSVWALLVPQGIAYSSIVGVPPQYGLYTALAALVGYAIFGTSRHLITGPSATVAAVSFSVIGLLSTDPQSTDWVSLTAALAAVTGLVYILLGLLRMGWISNFLSTAVLEGFIFAFGIGLIVDQSHKIFGVPKVDGSYWQVLVGTLQELPQTNLYTLAVGAAAIVFLLLMRRYLPRWPRALIVVVLGILLATVVPLNAGYGVKIVGPVPTGLSSVALPAIPWSDISTLLLGALAVVFVGFSETLAAARNAAAKHGYEIDVSQEMVAQGAATGAASLLGGYVVDGSLSKTTVADMAGQKTQMASLLTALLILLTVLFLAGLFTNLPEAVLGAVVIDAAIGLVKLPVLTRVKNTSSLDFAAFVAAGLGLFFIGVLAGVVVGVILSLLLLIWKASKAPVHRLGYDAQENVYVDVEKHPAAVQNDGIVVAALAGPLFFADAAPFRQSVLDMVDGQTHAVVIDLGSTNLIDMDGAEVLTRLHEELERKQVKVVLARVADSELAILGKTGTLAAIGPDHVYLTVRDAVAALQGRATA